MLTPTYSREANHLPDSAPSFRKPLNPLTHALNKQLTNLRSSILGQAVIALPVALQLVSRKRVNGGWITILRRWGWGCSDARPPLENGGASPPAPR